MFRRLGSLQETPTEVEDVNTLNMVQEPTDIPPSRVSPLVQTPASPLTRAVRHSVDLPAVQPRRRSWWQAGALARKGRTQSVDSRILPRTNSFLAALTGSDRNS